MSADSRNLREQPPSGGAIFGLGGQHATPAGAAAVGAATGAVIGLSMGPVTAVLGALGGGVAGLIAERLLHTGDAARPEGGDRWQAELDPDDIRARARARVLERDRGRRDSGRGEPALEEPPAPVLPGEDGELELRKEVRIEHRTVQVPIGRDEVVVERQPLERRPAKGPAGEPRAVRVRIRAEEALLEKREVVRDVISVAKRSPKADRPLPSERRKDPDPSA